MERSRHRALVIATAALAAGLLTACGAGFDATAIQPYSPSDGTMANTGDIRIQNALVVASPTVSTGVIVASIANRGDRDDTHTGITSPDGTVDLTGDGSLAAESAIRLGAGSNPSATISNLTKLAGQAITLRFTFAKSEPVSLRTVVLPASGVYTSITPGPTTPAE